MKRVSPLVTGLLIALIAAAAVTTPAAAKTRAPIALGISEPDWRSMDAVDTYEHELGRYPAIWSVWSDWGDTSENSNAQFPTQVIAGLKTRGIVAQVYWEPLDPSNPFDCAHWSLQNIIQGDHDAYIRQWAKDAKASDATILLRFAHEMNGYWYPWGTGNGGVCGNTPAKFRTAWKHVWDIFRGPGGEKATKVLFEYSVINTKQVTADYPGNKYVDYLGFTALDWPTKKKWKSLVQRMGPAIGALRKISKTKPIIASEVAAGYKASCAVCDKPAFFSDGYPAVYAKAEWATQLVAIVYFDYDMRSVGQEDWRVSSPPAALDEYKKIVANPNFQGTFP